MKALLLLGLASLVAAQTAGLDPCVLACAESAATAAGCDSITDTDCICTTAAGAFQMAALSCLEASCTAAEIAEAASVDAQLCAGASAGGSSPSTSPAGSTAPSAAPPASTPSPSAPGSVTPSGAPASVSPSGSALSQTPSTAATATSSPSLATATQSKPGMTTNSTVMSSTAAFGPPTVVVALSVSTEAGKPVTVSAGDITLASGQAVITTQSQSQSAAAAPATSNLPVQNLTIPATAPSVTYTGAWSPESNAIPTSSGTVGSGGQPTSQQPSTPLGPSLNNGNVPLGLQCPGPVLAAQTMSTSEVGATVSVQFTGTGIFFQLVPRNTTGIYTAWVDSPQSATSIDGYQEFLAQQQMSPGGSGVPSCQIGYGVEGLLDGTHNVFVRLDGPSPLAGAGEQAVGLTVAGFTQTAPNTTAATSGGRPARGVEGRSCIQSVVLLLWPVVAVFIV